MHNIIFYPKQLDIKIFDMGETKNNDINRYGIKGIYKADRYLIHYVVNGKGTFLYNGEKHTLTKGEAFFIKGGDDFFFDEDINKPWHFIWIEFNGGTVAEFINRCFTDNQLYKTSNPDIMHKCFKNMIESFSDAGSDETSFAGYTSLLALLENMINTNIKNVASKLSREESVFKNAKSFINSNLRGGVTVSDVIDHLNIDRSYLFKLFKKHEGKSPQQYIIENKMKIAYNLLQNQKVPVQEAAQNVGYFNATAFGKQYKAYYGFPPSKTK